MMSGKMAVLGAMLEKLRPMGDRIVVVSNSTQVLDLVGTLCRERNVSPSACHSMGPVKLLRGSRV